MKIQALYRFQCFEGCFDFCEQNGHYNWSIYRLVRQNGHGTFLDEFLEIFPEIFLMEHRFKDFKEISIISAINDNCDEHVEFFKHRFDLDCKYGFAQDIMLHDSHPENFIDVCYGEIVGFAPDTREWEQGLELSLDSQIKELLEGSRPVPLPV